MRLHKKTYDTWAGMIKRCTVPTHISYKYYGAKGVTVCDRWKNSYSAFLEDMGQKPQGLTIDRINNEIGYTPSNCRWATVKTQNNNKSDTRLLTFYGRTQNMTAWAIEVGLKPQTLWHRLFKKHWSLEKALTTPLVARSLRRNWVVIQEIK